MTLLQESFIIDMGRIDYKQFLLTQLLRDSNETKEYYDVLPYDILWDLSFSILQKYEKVENINNDLYSDIVEYISSNKQFLIDLGKEYQ